MLSLNELGLVVREKFNKILMYFHSSVIVSSWITSFEGNFITFIEGCYVLNLIGSGEENDFKCDKFTTKTTDEYCLLRKSFPLVQSYMNIAHIFYVFAKTSYSKQKCMHYQSVMKTWSHSNYMTW